MNSPAMILIALLALFIGVLIPVLLQLRSTLREVEKRLEAAGPRLDRILDDSQVVAHRLALVSTGLDGSEQSIRNAMTAVRDLTLVINRMTSWMGVASSVGAAVGPVVASAVHAYRSSQRIDDEELAQDEHGLAEDEEHGPAQDEPDIAPATSAWTTNTQPREEKRSRI